MNGLSYQAFYPMNGPLKVHAVDESLGRTLCGRHWYAERHRYAARNGYGDPYTRDDLDCANCESALSDPTKQWSVSDKRALRDLERYSAEKGHRNVSPARRAVVAMRLNRGIAMALCACGHPRQLHNDLGGTQSGRCTQCHCNAYERA